MTTLRPSSPPCELSCCTARRTPRSWSRPVAASSPLWGPSTAITSGPVEPDTAALAASTTTPVRTARRPMLARLLIRPPSPKPGSTLYLRERRPAKPTRCGSGSNCLAPWVAPAELSHCVVETLRLVEVAEVPGLRNDHERRHRDPLLELTRNAERRACVELAPEQQRRDGDLCKQLALIGLGHQRQLDPEAVAPHVGGDLA